MIPLLLVTALGLVGCGENDVEAPLRAEAPGTPSTGYLVGAGDTIQVFVWKSADLSTTVKVRPDGKISVPLIEDLPAAGYTPGEIAQDIQKRLADYVANPKVTVIVQDFVGPQIRVVGEAVKPQSIPYRKDMTVLDVVIASGGLTPFADGNEAVLIRRRGNKERHYRVRLGDLMRDADMSANVEVRPGDVLLIPQRWF